MHGPHLLDVACFCLLLAFLDNMKCHGTCLHKSLESAVVCKPRSLRDNLRFDGGNAPLVTTGSKLQRKGSQMITVAS